MTVLVKLATDMIRNKFSHTQLIEDTCAIIESTAMDQKIIDCMNRNWDRMSYKNFIDYITMDGKTYMVGMKIVQIDPNYVSKK